MREELIYSAERKYEDENGLTEEQFKTISPISKEDFNNLFTYCDSVPIPGGYRYVKKMTFYAFFVSYDKVLVMNYYVSCFTILQDKLRVLQLVQCVNL